MKYLIIINPNQFGYNNATYYYCINLKDDFRIIYICWDHGMPKIIMDGVQVVYVSRESNMMVRTIRFLRASLRRINEKQTIIFIKYFKVVSLALRILRPRHIFVLDIRTGSVNKSRFKRRFHDARLRFETLFFKHVTVISKSLAEKLGIKHKAHILPLGADVISSTDKTFDGLHLLYVGTLVNRNIDITVQGFKKFYDEFKTRISVKYTIIGDGPNNEARKLRNLVSALGLSGVVNVLGRIPHTELRPYFDACNVGISYVPTTDYYDCQPVTKTFEYLLSGMPVIATSTSENKHVIGPANGVVVGETAENFYFGLKSFFENRHKFDSAEIRNNAMEYTWENICTGKLKPFLKNVF